MISHTDIGTTAILRLIKKGVITLGGNKPGKIYGTLSCPSGKRMKTGNRVFFENEEEAIAESYRPCGHCMKGKYNAWKGSASV